MKTKWSVKIILLFLGAIVALILGYVIAQTGAWAIAFTPIILGSLILAYFIFKNPSLGFLLIIFFLPFERVPTLLLGGVDLKINTILGFLTIFAWLLILMFNGKKWKIQPNALAWPISLFIIALMLSLTQAVDLFRGAEVLIFILFTMILSFMTVNIVSNKVFLEKVVWSIFISAGFVGLFGLFQFGGDVIGLPRTITQLTANYDSTVFGFPRIQAFSMEPLYFANYLLIPLSLAFAYYFDHVDMMKRRWLIGFMVLFLVNFVLTVSRGGYLSLAVIAFLFLIFYLRQIFTRKTLIIFLVFVVVGGAVYYGLSRSENRALNSFVKQATLQDAKTGSDSVQGRLTKFDQAYNIFKEHPILGIGIGNYGPYAANFPTETPNGGWAVVNNQFIELLAETGLVGLISYSLILMMVIWRSFMALKKVKDSFLRATMFGFFAAFIGVMVQYNFFSTLYIIHIWVLIGLMIAVQNIILRKEEKI